MTVMAMGLEWVHAEPLGEGEGLLPQSSTFEGRPGLQHLSTRYAGV